jgi:hypothetical protein
MAEKIESQPLLPMHPTLVLTAEDRSAVYSNAQSDLENLSSFADGVPKDGQGLLTSLDAYIKSVENCRATR